MVMVRVKVRRSFISGVTPTEGVARHGGKGVCVPVQVCVCVCVWVGGRYLLTRRDEECNNWKSQNDLD